MSKTKRTTGANILQASLIVSLSLVLIFCCTESGFSAHKIRKGNKVYFNGNEFELLVSPPDSVLIEDPVTKQVMTRIVKYDPVPFRMNGRPIFHDDSYVPAVYNGKENTLEQFLFEQLRPALNSLDNGVYQFSVTNIVIDDKGKLVYFETDGVVPMYVPDKTVGISDAMRTELLERTSDLLEGDIKYKPAIKDGKPVNSTFSIGLNPTPRIVVRDHVARLE